MTCVPLHTFCRLSVSTLIRRWLAINVFSMWVRMRHTVTVLYHTSIHIPFLNRTDIRPVPKQQEKRLQPGRLHTPSVCHTWTDLIRQAVQITCSGTQFSLCRLCFISPDGSVVQRVIVYNKTSKFVMAPERCMSQFIQVKQSNPISVITSSEHKTEQKSSRLHILSEEDKLNDRILTRDSEITEGGPAKWYVQKSLHSFPSDIQNRKKRVTYG